MAHKVFYMSRSPKSHRDVVLSVQPSEFEDTWIETDDTEEVRTKLAEADFVVAGELSAEQIAKARRLKLIQAPGVGYENIDVEAAEARGIPVAITPEGTVVGVSEHAIMMILAIYKHLTVAHNALKEGRWIHNQIRPIASMLQEKRVGIVGMGRIGREVAKRLQGWDVDLVYYDIRRLPLEEEKGYGATFLSLDDLLRTADVVTLHIFLSASTRRLIGERELGLMKPTAILINTSRGGVVDEPALHRAIEEHRILAAGIDAWDVEPTPPDNPLLKLDNVLVTPHMATANRDAMIKKAQAGYANFQRVLRGEVPINTVRPYKVIEATARIEAG